MDNSGNWNKSSVRKTHCYFGKINNDKLRTIIYKNNFKSKNIFCLQIVNITYSSNTGHHGKLFSNNC